MTSPQDHTIVPTRRTYLRLTLDRMDLFKGVDSALVDELSLQFRVADVPAGEVVIRQGEMGDHLYVVDSGDLEVSATVNGRTAKLADLHRGDFFGEIALLKGTPRTATITAVTAATLWTLSGEALNRWLDQTPALKERMQAVMRRRELANALRALQ
jgi:cAMP-dependent protein kinase regulator